MATQTAGLPLKIIQSRRKCDSDGRCRIIWSGPSTGGGEPPGCEPEENGCTPINGPGAHEDEDNDSGNDSGNDSEEGEDTNNDGEEDEDTNSESNSEEGYCPETI